MNFKEGTEKIYEFTVRRPDGSTFEQGSIVYEPDGVEEARENLQNALRRVAPRNEIVSDGNLMQTLYNPVRAAERASQSLFHQLWGQAKASPEYDKSKWTEFEKYLHSRGVIV